LGHGSYFVGKKIHHPQPPKNPRGEIVDKNGFELLKNILGFKYLEVVFKKVQNVNKSRRGNNAITFSTKWM
jgi:hypothetical protein